MAAASVRTAASVALLVTGYYLAPLEGRSDTVAWPWFGLALALLGVVVVRQIVAVARSGRPRLRALEALGVMVPLLLVVFAATYTLISGADPDSFTEPVGRTDALYFTMTVFATVGFGDIAAVAEPARIVVTIQMVVGLVLVGVVAKVVVGAVDVATRRHPT
ncbi:potassium channel family protein [Saccharomonospora iraqiensis]|uniref:potassium channel family protein n=1 Tax=Saccharomonospora iraqiensis TaxID=52698 RepID=UPI00054D4A5A|nr:potassium channel family protein [Saccharomonospora iraqiensis]